MSTLYADEEVEQGNQALLVALQRAESAEEEIAALRQQHILLKDFCEKERAQNTQLQQQIEELHRALHDKEKRVHDLNEQRHRHMRHPELEAALQQEREALNSQKATVASLEQNLKEAQQHHKQLERVIHFLRERAEEGTLELKQLRTEFQASQEQITTLTQQYQTAREEATSLAQRLSDEQASQQDSISQQKHVIALLNSELANLRQDKRQMEETLVSVKAAHEEKELGLKMAQQHLAKKMKEAAILSEKIEEQKIHALELQHALVEAQTKLISMQQNNNIQAQHDKRSLEQLQENLKSLEGQVKKWEEKYFQIYDQWQQAEQAKHRFSTLAENHRQMQGLMTSLGALMGISSNLASHTQTSTSQTQNQPQQPTIILDSQRMQLEEKKPEEPPFDPHMDPNSRFQTDPF